MRTAVIILLFFASCSTDNNQGTANAVTSDSLQEYQFAASSKIVRGKVISKQQAWSDISKTEISNCIEVITVYKGDVAVSDTLVFRFNYSNDSSAVNPPDLRTGAEYIIFFTDVSTGSSSCGGTSWHKVYELAEGTNIKEYDPGFEKNLLERLKRNTTK